MKDLIKPLIVTLLTWEAKLVLKRKKPFIIGVTGNLGKTSTKDAIYSVMKDHFNVRRSQKSMNSEFGVPLTILGEKSGWSNPLSWFGILFRGLFVSLDEEYPTHLVLEIGADRPGDIESITKWVKPDIATVTQFGQVPVHIEFFENRDAIVREKGFLVQALKKNGLFIWNADDHDALTLLERTQERKMSVGIHNHAEVEAHNVKAYGAPSGTHAEFIVFGKRYDMDIEGVLGKSPVYAYLPALAVAHELQIPIEKAVEALKEAGHPAGRMRLLEGINNTILIDDTYNASPKATEHGLKTLEELDVKGRKIAVLGDMLELGEYSRNEHYKIGQLAAKAAHILITVGIRSRVTAEGALDSKMKDKHIITCDTSIDAGRELLSILKEGDVVYFKGSQGMRVERAVKMVLASHHDPKMLLVRQESHWEQR
jgi:UDP-N-acetylmuramoyl-tripeptide--D-alanyl-D-alanine ligase